DHLHHDLLRIAVDHGGVLGEEQLVLHAGVTLALTTLDHIGLTRHVDVEDRHAVDRAGLAVASGRVDHVVGAQNDGDISLREVFVDVFQVVDDVVGHTGFGQQHVHVTRHTSGNRVDGEGHVHALLLQQLHELVQLVLRLGYRQTVARNDDHLAGVVHGNCSVGCVSCFHGALDFAVFAAVIAAELAEDHIADRTVHGLGHHQRQQGTARADHGTGNGHRRVLQHEAFEGNGQTGEGVVQGDHHRHVGAADRCGQQYAQHQCQDEEQGHQREGNIAFNAGYNNVGAQSQRAQEQHQIDELLGREAEHTVHATIELGPGNQRAGQRHGAEQGAQYRRDGGHDTAGRGDTGAQRGSAQERIRPPSPARTETTLPWDWALPETSSVAATAAAAPPPMPLYRATIWGMSVMATFLPLYQAQPRPRPSAISTSATFMFRCS